MEDTEIVEKLREKLAAHEATERSRLVTLAQSKPGPSEAEALHEYSAQVAESRKISDVIGRLEWRRRVGTTDTPERKSLALELDELRAPEPESTPDTLASGTNG